LKMTDSQSLLAEYARSGSDTAFRELVSRFVDLVYSTALRLVEGDTHLAEDVTQAVFVDLARQARTLSQEVRLGGWLHRHTCFAAANTMRGERRRQSRERQAAEMNALQNTPEADFSQVAPLLDEAINELADADRTAILLRFFERQAFHAVGAALGSNEGAARMRVNRALEKLEFLLKQRGVTTTAGALAIALAANAVQAAPAGLAVTVLTAAHLAGTTIAATATATAIKTIAMTTMQKTVIGATLAAALGTGIYETHLVLRLREHNQSLQQQQNALVEQMVQLKSDNAGLSNQLAQASGPHSLSTDRLRELLRLRGEVGVLRRQQRELEQAVATAQSKTRDMPVRPSLGVTPQLNKPPPFQLQLVVDQPGDDTEAMTNASSASGETLQVQKTPLLDYTAISSATVTRDASSGAPEINVEFSQEGKDLFAAITKENINKRLAIVMDGHLYSAPVIRSEISDGNARITGHFTEEQAKALAAKINEAVGVFSGP
jgi:RNA polymerase sigma factor (sigma-70 family)